eukprot:TRINITY_DN12502_c0_g1_i1.p1 TRINITY_DN12502_c0_g1~~TRINITY_DN12502_c0_g1_i1.p1  ORF type:complete len:820 (-),score=268.59 TRINITY_DN12502_c0_g1_i1:26-2230(-)
MKKLLALQDAKEREAAGAEVPEEPQGVQLEAMKKYQEVVEDKRLRTVHIAPLPNDTTKEQVEILCQNFGEVNKIRLDFDEKGECFAIVEFKEKGPAHVCKVRREFLVDGNHVIFSESKTLVDTVEFAEESVAFTTPTFNVADLMQIAATQERINSKLAKARLAAKELFNEPLPEGFVDPAAKQAEATASQSAEVRNHEDPLNMFEDKPDARAERRSASGERRRRRSRSRSRARRRKAAAEGSKSPESRRQRKRERKGRRDGERDSADDGPSLAEIVRKAAAAAAVAAASAPGAAVDLDDDVAVVPNTETCVLLGASSSSASASPSPSPSRDGRPRAERSRSRDGAGESGAIASAATASADAKAVEGATDAPAEKPARKRPKANVARLNSLEARLKELNEKLQAVRGGAASTAAPDKPPGGLGLAMRKGGSQANVAAALPAQAEVPVEGASAAGPIAGGGASAAAPASSSSAEAKRPQGDKAQAAAAGGAGAAAAAPERAAAGARRERRRKRKRAPIVRDVSSESAARSLSDGPDAAQSLSDGDDGGGRERGLVADVGDDDDEVAPVAPAPAASAAAAAAAAAAPAAQAQAAEPAPAAADDRGGRKTWECLNCGELNRRSRRLCNNCGARPDGTLPANDVVVGSSSSSSSSSEDEGTAQQKLAGPSPPRKIEIEDDGEEEDYDDGSARSIPDSEPEAVVSLDDEAVEEAKVETKVYSGAEADARARILYGGYQWT